MQHFAEKNTCNALYANTKILQAQRKIDFQCLLFLILYIHMYIIFLILILPCQKPRHDN